MASERRIEGDLSAGFLMDALGVGTRYGVTDQRLGPGYWMDVGTADTRLRLAVFEQAKAIVINTQGFQMNLRGVERVSRRGNEVRFELVLDHEQMNVDVLANGTYALRKIPRDEGGTRRTPAEDDSPRADTPERQLQDQPPDERERVTLRGRVGKAPTFRTTARRNLLIGSFPLGIHPDLETTEWHTILVFGVRAGKLKEKGLTPGQEIEIVGYPHERAVPLKTGGTKTVREIYATAIRTTLRKP